jgi:hypothetical protein
MKKLLAVSYFKKVAKAFTQGLLLMLKKAEDIPYIYLKAQLEEFF